MATWAINFKDVRIDKKRPFTLIFTAYVPTLSNNNTYELEFTGPDLVTIAGITKGWKKELKEQLKADYGYGPYDIKKAKAQLKKKFEYRI